MPIYYVWWRVLCVVPMCFACQTTTDDNYTEFCGISITPRYVSLLGAFALLWSFSLNAPCDTGKALKTKTVVETVCALVYCTPRIRWDGQIVWKRYARTKLKYCSTGTEVDIVFIKYILCFAWVVVFRIGRKGKPYCIWWLKCWFTGVSHGF